MNRMTRKMMIITAALATMTAFAAPEVTDVVAKQRYPWNGLVDITCKVTGINGTTNGLKFAVAAVMPESGEVRRVWNFWVMQSVTKLPDRQVYTNGNYRLLWDASAELGQVSYDNMVMRVTVVELHEKVQLWEGGPYWATTNIGAEKPADYGYYFCWGDTMGYKREGVYGWVSSDGSSSIHFIDEAFNDISFFYEVYDGSIDSLKLLGMVTDGGVLSTVSDAAHVHWGGDWRMPTKNELDRLRSKCDWTWTTMNGVTGYVITGKGSYASSSIFLPAAGYGFGDSLNYVGSIGRYWSSVPKSYADEVYGTSLEFYSSSYYTSDNGSNLDYGLSIRPVQ